MSVILGITCQTPASDAVGRDLDEQVADVRRPGRQVGGPKRHDLRRRGDGLGSAVDHDALAGTGVVVEIVDLERHVGGT